MNRQKIAQELVKLARELTGAPDKDAFRRDVRKVIRVLRGVATEANIVKKLQRKYGMYTTMWLQEMIDDGEIQENRMGGVRTYSGNTRARLPEGSI